MQLQLLSQISMPIFRRVCRTYVFHVRLFLVSCLLVCLLFFVVVGLSGERVNMVCSKFGQSAMNC